MLKQAATRFAIVLLLSGCAVDHYKELGATLRKSRVERNVDRAAIIYLEPVFVGKRFDEVTCDNIVGAVWNPAEAKKVGYTANVAQGMAMILPLLALEATLPYNIGTGRVASGHSPLSQVKVDGRILVPLGSYISRHIEHTSSSVFGRSSICYDTACVEERRRANPGDPVATVRFTKFRVAEEKANRLTLVAEGVSTVLHSNGDKRESAIKYEIVERSVMSEGAFSWNAVQAMSKMTDELAESIADQVVGSINK